jgi:hypothetical protein
MSPRPVGHLYSCIDDEATNVVCRVVAFDRVACNVLNPLGGEHLSEFFGKTDEQIEVMVEDGRVHLKVRETSVNAAGFCAHLGQNRCR